MRERESEREKEGGERRKKRKGGEREKDRDERSKKTLIKPHDETNQLYNGGAREGVGSLVNDFTWTLDGIRLLFGRAFVSWRWTFETRSTTQTHYIRPTRRTRPDGLDTTRGTLYSAPCVTCERHRHRWRPVHGCASVRYPHLRRIRRMYARTFLRPRSLTHSLAPP